MSQILMLHVACVALLLALASGCVVADESSECPNWYHRPPGSHHCQCGPTLQGGYDDGVYLRVDYIMTWDTATNQTLAARNNYGYGYDNYSTIIHRVYTLMPNDSQYLNETMCAPNNREGFLCEDCVPGYGPTAYSPKCINCREHSTLSAIALFLTLKLGPITVMFTLLMIFRINVTQGPIFGYVLYCQAHIIIICSIGSVEQTVYRTTKQQCCRDPCGLTVARQRDVDMELHTFIPSQFQIETWSF